MFQNSTLVGNSFASLGYPLDGYRRLASARTKIEDSDLPGTEILETTFGTYGVFFLASFVIFLFLRNRFLQAYNVNDSVEEYRTPISARFHGPLSWMWNVFLVSDEEIFNHCGMDAIVFIRSLRYGRKVAYAGMFTSVFLLPLYFWSYSSSSSSYAGSQNTTDLLDMLTLGVVHNEIGELEPVFAAPVLAAYIVFGYALYLLLDEFAWYTKYRHRHLAKALPNNYTVYVKHIPPNMRSDKSLLAYFSAVFPSGDVVDARVALATPKLDRLVAERKVVVDKLEHAINVYNLKNVRPQHMPIVPKTPPTSIADSIRNVDSIDTYTSELAKLNISITKGIENVEKLSGDNPDYGEDQLYNIEESITCFEGIHSSFAPSSDMRSSIRSGKNKGYEVLDGNDSLLMEIPTVSEQIEFVDELEEGSGPDLSENNGPDLSKKDRKRSTKKKIKKKAAALRKKTVKSLAAAGTGIVAGASAVADLLSRNEGKRLDAGFVSFRTLTARQTAIQMIHSCTPFTMTVEEAPHPKDILWNNVGKDHRAELAGKVTGNALTVTLCLFWTVLSVFVTSLGKVDSLVSLLPFLGRWKKKNDLIGKVLVQIEPLLLVVLLALLSIVLMKFAKHEGLVSESQLQASLFQKLSLFLIIQFFFVRMISGSVLAELRKIINNPHAFVDLLDTAVPEQSNNFMQYVLVQTFVYLSEEILRLQPIIFAWIRSKIGPNLTEKERKQPWIIFRPLCVSEEFEFSTTQANLILFYTILLVYSVISPVLNWIMCFTFFLLSLVYRHQVFYIYPPTNDTGGYLFPQFVKMVIGCIYIAEITLIGLLSLKEAAIAASMLFPLIIGTVFFNMYINLEHYRLTKFLPSTMSVEEDKKNIGLIDFDELLIGKYLQPSMQKKTLEPESVLKE
eukprot:CAMPEP_0194286570 /NCGR_PEP_ID=MMETSP0169-20130528/32792_1 /TAXON_ID=218684 /ORGANISM="Corethron pennatum, Strain L29A3" /LENGTH=899 /DNA_ID=CAMNT_0039033047 /DNA_START=142 /DNA_END=2838 /DNA_ORIENTATION=+